MIAFSTAFSDTLVGIDIKGKKDFLSLDANIKQSENLLKSIDELLDKNQVNLVDNDSFGVVIGPGSFTGLRVGLALVKGLCAGLSKESQVVAISSLDFMAYEYIKKEKPSHDFVCAINALSGLRFVCEYSAKGQKLGIERMIDSREYSQIKLIKVGLVGENIADKNLVLTPQSLLEIAENKLKQGETVDIKSLSPTYLRKSQAEAQLEEKNLKKS